MRFSIVIPCYNEARRLDLEQYKQFLSDQRYNNVFLLFVDDGSSDETPALLKTLADKFSSRCELLSLEKNVGKAEAIRRGMLRLSEQSQGFDYVGYMDADLAVPLTSISLAEEMLTKYSQPSMIMGSRIKLFGTTNIKRSSIRHYVGRMIATLISLQLKLPVYDTQCGFKFIRKDIIDALFNERFISRWLFDVELIWRLLVIFGYEKISQQLIEFPVMNWEEKGASKVPLTYIFWLPLELMRIRSKYSAAMA